MNRFDIDKQTLADLNVYDTYGSKKSVFSLFNLTTTIKGHEKLADIFRTPSTDIQVIHERQSVIKYFSGYPNDLSFDRTNMDFVESYLNQNSKISYYSPVSALFKAVNYFFYPNQVYYLKEKGTREIVLLLKKLNGVFNALGEQDKPELVKEFDAVFLMLTKNDLVKTVVECDKLQKFSLWQLEELDFIFRNIKLKAVKQLLDLTYQIDAYFSVVKAMRINNLTWPDISTMDRRFKITGVFHPFLVNPVNNDVEFGTGQNVCFLTGSNMAGKSTLLKATGLSIFLAHLGLPVPAKRMETGIWQGLISTINLPDNLNEGYSHFYSEVLRVKHVAGKIKASKNFFVIFDELFRGTNVKDAFDGSLAVIDLFSKVKDCCFVISTHIVEVAERLKDRDNISFRYLFTKMENGKPIFTYELLTGITEERIGMWIIENEKISEILTDRALNN